MSRTKRILSGFLALIMVLTLAPVVSAAGGADTAFTVTYDEDLAEAPSLLLFDVDTGMAVDVDWTVNRIGRTVTAGVRRDMLFTYGHRYSLTVRAAIDESGGGSGGDPTELPDFDFDTVDEALTALYAAYAQDPSNMLFQQKHGKDSPTSAGGGRNCPVLFLCA